MKRIASIVSLLALLTSNACKHKDNTPSLAASASAAATLPSTAALPSAASATPSVGEFEGEVGLLAKGKVTGNDAAPLALTLRIKGGKLRVDVPESLTKARELGPAYLIVLPADKKAYAVLEAKKQAVLLELDKLAEQAKAMGARAPKAGAKGEKAAPPKLEKTGKFDTVAGTRCEIWHFEQGKSAGDACIADQATPWFQFPMPTAQAPAELSWVSEIADGKHLPLRFVATEKNLETARVEVSSIQQKALPANLFEVPADYAVVNLEQMMAAMLGGLGGPGFKLPQEGKLPAGRKLPPGVGVTLRQ